MLCVGWVFFVSVFLKKGEAYPGSSYKSLNKLKVVEMRSL